MNKNMELITLLNKFKSKSKDEKVTAFLDETLSVLTENNLSAGNFESKNVGIDSRNTPVEVQKIYSVGLDSQNNKLEVNQKTRVTIGQCKIKKTVARFALAVDRKNQISLFYEDLKQKKNYMLDGKKMKFIPNPAPVDAQTKKADYKEVVDKLFK